jgi:hypothetical protein
MESIDQTVAGLTSSERRYLYHRAALGRIQLSIKLLDGDCFFIEATASTSISELKRRLMRERPGFVFNLFKAGEENCLPDDCAVGALGTMTLFLVPREKLKGSHSFVVSGTTFMVHKKFSLHKDCTKWHDIYSSSWIFDSVAISALDAETGEKVTITKTPDAFEDERDSSNYDRERRRFVRARSMLAEIKLMRHFQHENIVRALEILRPPPAPCNDIYVVSEFMPSDLRRVIDSRQLLGADHAQYFMYQLLRGLEHLHSAGVLHRDIQPANLLLNEQCDLKICAFCEAR